MRKMLLIWTLAALGQLTCFGQDFMKLSATSPTANYAISGQIAAGETKIIEHDCYKRLIIPEDTEAFEQPDPEPEDRDRYREFQAYRTKAQKNA